jgi:hypothetical protein
MIFNHERHEMDKSDFCPIEISVKEWVAKTRNTGRPTMPIPMSISSAMEDAYVAAAWLRQVDMDGRLTKFLKPDMLPGEYHVAQVEGWILGVT